MQCSITESSVIPGAGAKQLSEHWEKAPAETDARYKEVLFPAGFPVFLHQLHPFAKPGIVQQYRGEQMAGADGRKRHALSKLHK